MVEAKYKVEFERYVTVAAPSGGQAATLGYQFLINGQRKVTVWASRFPGKLSQEEVRDLASKQIETELGNGVDLEDGAELRFIP